MNAAFLSLATEQFKASAAQAAQTLVTIGANLDEMAASDAYVQSDGFNTNKTNTNKHPLSTTQPVQDPQPRTSNQRNSVHAPAAAAAPQSQHRQRPDPYMGGNNDDDASTISTHSSAPSLLRTKWSDRMGVGATVPPMEPPADVVPLKVNVPNAKLASSHQRLLAQSSSQRPNDESSAEEDDDEDDPILAYARRTNAPNKANRFMNDLEARMATPALPPQPLVAALSSSSSQPVATETNAAWLSTFRDAMAMPVVAANARRPAPLARAKPAVISTVETIVRSNAVTLLDDSEWRALEQLRQTQPNTSHATCLDVAQCSIIQQHRREVFLALTLVLAMMVYYLYANSMSVGQI